MPSNTIRQVRALSDAQLDQFVQDGFVRLDNAFPRELAEEGRAILWCDTGCDPGDRKTWTRPVIRLGYYGQEPFRKAVNTPVLHAAFDQLVGKGRWRPRADLGSFPVRFPHTDDPGDTGWHVDLSFPGPSDDPNERNDFSAWRVNVTSRGRALLMLFLFSDIGELDAPTRIRVGSHLDMARLLQPAGEAGMAHLMLSDVAADRPEVPAVGEAGTVYLCHPFLIHAAQPHRGARPRFMAQPPLHPAEPVRLEGEDGDYSPVEMAIRPPCRTACTEKRADAVRIGRPEPDGVREDHGWSKSDACTRCGKAENGGRYFSGRNSSATVSCSGTSGKKLSRWQ